MKLVSERTRASSRLCLSPVSLPIPIPKTQSAYRPLAQRNAFRRRGARQKCRFITHRAVGQTLTFSRGVAITVLLQSEPPGLLGVMILLELPFL